MCGVQHVSSSMCVVYVCEYMAVIFRHAPTISFTVEHCLKTVLKGGAELCEHAAGELGMSRVQQVDGLVMPLLLGLAPLCV